METRKRSLVKALVWNAIGFASMVLVGFLATGSAKLGGTMALINTALGFGCYVIYERVWSRISWGLRSEFRGEGQIAERLAGQANV
ncbi:hypothetical protein MED193_19749 [Roseobacter sp. MED193]|nr:hypothetical protein MED193_19749 [Roseobacter sp. MED193]